MGRKTRILAYKFKFETSICHSEHGRGISRYCLRKNQKCLDFARHDINGFVKLVSEFIVIRGCKMKTLGIIGGLGPESTIDYYGRIIEIYRERTRDDSYPQFLVNSVALDKVRELVIADDRTRLAETIVKEIEKLARASAEFGLIAANTPHLVFDEITERSPIPLIGIVEATCTAAKDRQLKRFALFGTKFTMTGDFYPKIFSREGIALISPDSADQDYIHDKYMNELVLGEFLPETRVGLLAIIDRMKAKNDIEGVILAGTELPLILRDEIYDGIPLLNTTKIHCEAAVAEMLS